MLPVLQLHQASQTFAIHLSCYYFQEEKATVFLLTSSCSSKTGQLSVLFDAGLLQVILQKHQEQVLNPAASTPMIFFLNPTRLAEYLLSLNVHKTHGYRDTHVKTQAYTLAGLVYPFN